MSYDLDHRFPPFMIGDHDRLTIGGKAFRLAYMSGESAVLKPAESDGVAETFEFSRLRRLNAAGKITHEVEYFLPEEYRTTRGRVPEVSVLAPVSQAARDRMDIAYAMAQVTIHLQDHEDPAVRIGKTDHALGANMDLIRELAADYLVESLPDPDQIEKLRLYRAGEGRKPKGGKAAPMPDAVHPSTLRKWVTQVRSHGKYGVVPAYSRRGFRANYFSPEEKALMAKVIRKQYLTPQRISIAATARDVAAAFAEENRQRTEQGLSQFRTPSREAVRLYIRKLDKFSVAVARYGRNEAMKRMKPVGQGLEVSRPLERVEMDEWQIDLISMMAESGLMGLFTPEEIEALGLKDGKGRWWLVVAIDCRTRVILGMQLVNNPRTTAAMECLRMVMEDKGAFADAVGAVTPWDMFGKPESLVTDNGCFKSKIFTDCCAELGIILERTIAGHPAMRGRVERFFRTAIEGVCSRLSGRTFANALERGDHDAEERACLDTNDLCFALVRWIVDVYHNTPHEGLGGLTPLEQWRRDHAQGNFPLHAAPDQRRKRLALGVALKRKLHKDGLTILGICYHSEELSASFLHNGGQVLDLRWSHTDLGAIEVFFDDRWNEVLSVHETADGERPFDGLTAQEWIVTRRALSARDEKQKIWDETVVFEAMKEIRAMNAARQLSVQIMDKNWNQEDLDKKDASLFAGFRFRSSRPQTRHSDDDYGRSIEPTAPEGADPTPAPRKRNNWTKKKG